MKKPKLFIFLLGLLFLGSSDPNDFYWDAKYIPVLMNRTELEKSITYVEPQELNSIGKIYTKGNYIFISKKYKGIHIINNTDPAHPVNEGFITVPGCLDMAVKNNSLYVDNATDLVAIDISGIPTISVTKRVPNIFPELIPPDQWQMPKVFRPEYRPKNTVIVEWRENPDYNQQLD